MGDSFPSQTDIDQVLAVCPELDTNDVRRDLKFTRNVEMTVNRALDGRFLRGVFDLLDVADQPAAAQPTCDSSTDINSDDDDLPNITLQPTACTSNVRYASKSRKEISDSDSDSDSEPRFQQYKKHAVVTKQKKGQASNDTSTGNKKLAANCTGKKVDTLTGRHALDSPSKSSGNVAKIEDDVISVGSKSSPMEKYNTFKRRPQDLSPSGSSSEDDIPTPPRKLQREEAETKPSGKQAFSFKKSAASSVVAISSSDSDSDSSDSDAEDKWKRPLSYRLNSSKPAKVPSTNDNTSTKGSSSDEVGSKATSNSSTVTPKPRSAIMGDSVENGESGLTLRQSLWSDEADSQGTKNKGKRRSPEEIQERKRQALLKRQEKELERQRKKEKMEQERDAKKKMKEMEAARKRAEREASKNMKPGECLKFITVVLDRHLAESPCGGNILKQLQDSESKVQILDQLVPYSVSWRRTVTLHNFGGDVQLGSISTKEIEEEETLVYVPVADFVLQVYNYKQQQQGDSCVSQETLQSFVHGVKSIYEGKKVTLIILGLEKYFRNQSNQRQRQFRDIVRNNGEMTEDSKKGKRKKKKEMESTTIITRMDVEEALVHLQLWEDVVVKLLEEPEQVADMIRMYTKAVAETPFKRQRDESTFSFHIESDAVNCVKVDKDGRGLLKLWQRHIQQMRNVSPEMAAAIVAEYPSPQLLIQAYERCSTEKEAQLLLKDIMVRRGAGVLATSRRIGPELSRKLHMLFTSSDGEKLLHSAS
ncbi:crossover junction endonuclease EME1-like [Branchiostoma floridae]|uniref:Crossover junction endonuclease EME1-like n=1 Tax=Branchiostoma floridae TaxID=7739 RepID=A0A9J7N8B6_BRAFL|nr:crossover junction endonuclease EME1-like [Branchiostoma floridae]